MKSVYIAGPMSGYPEFNFPAFFAAQATLEALGYKVWNPAAKDAENDFSDETYKAGDAAASIEEGFDLREAYLWDIEKVINSDAIYMLKGWEASPGARGEHGVAMVMKKHYPAYEILYQN
jgi:hypothetical protein